MTASKKSVSSSHARQRTKTRPPPIAKRVTLPGGPSVARGAQLGGAPLAAPPSLAILSVLSGYRPGNPADLRGYRVIASQLAVTPDALDELGRCGDLGPTLGSGAPDIARLTRAVRVAHAWTLFHAQAVAWSEYACSEEGLAWKYALGQLKELKPFLDLASRADPELATKYPAILRLVGAKAVVARRAAASRTKKRMAKAEAQGPTPDVASPKPK